MELITGINFFVKDMTIPKALEKKAENPYQAYISNQHRFR